MDIADDISARLCILEFTTSVRHQQELALAGSKYVRFHCRECGSDEVLCKPFDAEGICPGCCEARDEHEFTYERDEREWQCQHCGESAPPDFWAYEPD